MSTIAPDLCPKHLDILVKGCDYCTRLLARKRKRGWTMDFPEKSQLERIALVMADFGISDTDDVPMEDVLRGALVQMRAELADLREGGRFAWKSKHESAEREHASELVQLVREVSAVRKQRDQLRAAVDRARALANEWQREAAVPDVDGYTCCGEIRRKCADELYDALGGVRRGLS